MQISTVTNMLFNLCRSLVANLAAANHFNISHLEKPEITKLMEGALFYYISVRITVVVHFPNFSTILTK